MNHTFRCLRTTTTPRVLRCKYQPSLTTRTTSSIRCLTYSSISPSKKLQSNPQPRRWPSRRLYSTELGESGEARLEPRDGMDEKEREIWDLLVGELEPVVLNVQDVSGGCGSMYSIEITSEKFRGLNMLKQQRVVNTVLKGLIGGWHGVQLKTGVP